jgi:Xaa-Pro aminopeptidase
MRRIKSSFEIDSIEEAVRITSLGHARAAGMVGHNVYEREIVGAIEGDFIASGAQIAFPSIVASGPQATILHYDEHNRPMQNGELVVVDIGASVNGYCADISRTYPVSGIFTDRQKELYEIVLRTQEYIASLARPGYWLSNVACPEKSLYHLAVGFLKDHGGYDLYFSHGIGHYLGLDVHDVGSYAQPLAEHDVITIEPGIYISQEGIGIRIEDNYVLTADGVNCLSTALPKKIEEIEEFMQAMGQGCIEGDCIDCEEA